MQVLSISDLKSLGFEVMHPDEAGKPHKVRFCGLLF